MTQTQTCSLSHTVLSDVGQTTALCVCVRLNRAGRPGSIARPLAQNTFLSQSGFQSYLRGRGTFRSNNLNNQVEIISDCYTYIHPCSLLLFIITYLKQKKNLIYLWNFQIRKQLKNNQFKNSTFDVSFDQLSCILSSGYRVLFRQ